MAASPRNLPRFLPTLTEVVDPASVPVTAVAASPGLSDHALIERVVQRLAPLLERQLHERLGALVDARLAQIAVQLQHELEQTLRRSVQEALAEERAAVAQRAGD